MKQNISSIRGNIAQDIVIKTASNGNKYCTFTVFENRYNKTKDGKFERKIDAAGKQVADTYRCIAWNENAVKMANLKKGHLVKLYAAPREVSATDKFKSFTQYVADSVEPIMPSKANKVAA